MKKLGLVLGRFQPLHDGHLHLIKHAFKENDFVLICIGSAQKSDPLPIEKRHKRVDSVLKKEGFNNYKIVDFKDPENMDEWPVKVKEACDITDETINTFYRSDNDLTEKWKNELQNLGFKIKICPRINFQYKAPDGKIYAVNSATEIKKIHKNLDCKI